MLISGYYIKLFFLVVNIHVHIYMNRNLEVLLVICHQCLHQMLGSLLDTGSSH